MRKSAPSRAATMFSRFKWYILILVIVTGIVALASSLLSDKSETVEALVSVEFPGVGSGLNPDGSKFDINKMIEDDILEKVIERLNLNIKAEDLSKNIVINPLFPNGIVERITLSRQRGESYAFHPTEFNITCNISDKEGIDKETGELILSTLVDIYQEEFYSLYADQGILLGIAYELDFESYDYPDITKVIINHINVINTYLADKETTSGEFRSKATNQSFGDLIQSFEVIRDVDLARIDSMIDAYNLTKNKEKLILSYENMIKRLELDREKKLGESQKAREMMDVFQRDENLIYLTGTGTRIEGLDTGSYYDELADRATAAKVEADNINHDIEYYRKEIDKLKNDMTSSSDKRYVEEDLLKMLENLSHKLAAQKEAISKTVDEYNKSKLGNAFKIIEME